jgi:hypothetical protein
VTRLGGSLSPVNPSTQQCYLPSTRVIALSMYDEADKKQSMCEAGAESYSLKTVSADPLLAAIRARGAKLVVDHRGRRPAGPAWPPGATMPTGSVNGSGMRRLAWLGSCPCFCAASVSMAGNNNGPAPTLSVSATPTGRPVKTHKIQSYAPGWLSQEAPALNGGKGSETAQGLADQLCFAISPCSPAPVANETTFARVDVMLRSSMPDFKQCLILPSPALGTKRILALFDRRCTVIAMGVWATGPLPAAEHASGD